MNKNRKERSIRFVRVQMDESLERQIRKLRRPRGAMNVVFADTQTLSRLADVVSVDDNCLPLNDYNLFISPFVTSNRRMKMICFVSPVVGLCRRM